MHAAGRLPRLCETALLYWTGPYVLSQGDFAPWNIRNLGSQLFVFDWGRRAPTRARSTTCCIT